MPSIPSIPSSGAAIPLPDERSYLVELLTLISTPPGQGRTLRRHVSQLAGMVVDEMFRWRADRTANAEPRSYIMTRIDNETRYGHPRLQGTSVREETTWWDIVDGKLYEAGEIRLASIAQRYAVPTLTDAATAARRPQIRALLDETSIGSQRRRRDPCLRTHDRLVDP